MDKRKDIVKRENQLIQYATLIFVCGNILFILGCTTIVWYGWLCVNKFFHYGHLQSWEKVGVLVGLGGLLLIFQILFSFFQENGIPKKYTEITKNSHYELFKIIDCVRKQLNISKSIRVFITNTASASIFVLPDIQNMVRTPERFLAIGNPLIENLTKEELKAILLHEFAHITQDEINDTAKANSIGLFADSFLSERIEMNAKYGPGNMMLTMNTFYYMFLDYLCRYIKKHYERLTDELEYQADNIATQYIEPRILAEALLHITKLSGAEVSMSLRKRIEQLDGDVLGKNEKNPVEMNKARIHIHLSHRKHFIPWIDYKYSLLLNGKDVGDGNLINGYTIEKNVVPGLYTIEIFSFINTLVSQPYTFEADAGYIYHIELDYKYNFISTKYTIFCQEMKMSEIK